MITGTGVIDRKPSLMPSIELKKPIEIISLCSSEEDDSPIRAIVCLKRRDDIKRVEESEECFILDFDPFESADLSKLSLKNKNPAGEDVSDISIIAEKGQCYCFVCDSAAPCKYWDVHCHAHDADGWKNQRKMHKDLMMIQKKVAEVQKLAAYK